MFTFGLLLLFIMCAMLVVSKKEDDKPNLKQNPDGMSTLVHMRLKSQELGGMSQNGSHRRRMDCVCGNVNTTTDDSCLYVVCDGCDCGNIICNRHSYCNYTENVCGCCEHVGSLGHDTASTAVFHYIDSAAGA